MDKQQTVLITRPQPGADEFAASLIDVPVVISPMMDIQHLRPDLGNPATVVMTSSHAIEAIKDLDAPCFCVGEATSLKAREAGMNVVMVGETAADVAASVIHARPQGDVLYARGKHIAFDLTRALNEAGISASEAVVYDQTAQDLTDEAMSLLQSGTPTIAPVFSVRSAALFFDACPSEANLQVIAISQNVANEVPVAHRDGLVVALKPDAASMVKATLNAAILGKRLEKGQSPQ